MCKKKLKKERFFFQAEEFNNGEIDDRWIDDRWRKKREKGEKCDKNLEGWKKCSIFARFLREVSHGRVSRQANGKGLYRRAYFVRNQKINRLRWI